jgi:hypothetical protein
MLVDAELFKPEKLFAIVGVIHNFDFIAVTFLLG